MSFDLIIRNASLPDGRSNIDIACKDGKSAAVEAMVDKLLTSTSREDFVAATRALDRVLTSGRYVIPIWFNPVSRIAHASHLQYPEALPIYGDWLGFQPEVWWSEE